MAMKEPRNGHFGIFKMSAGILRAMIVCFVAGCDMFSPRAVEKPQGVFIDRLHLSEIMNHTGQQFSKSTYEDILHPDFIFKAYNDKSFSQTEEITRLKSIIVDQTVHASWDTCPGNYQGLPDTITVCRKFAVAYHKTASNSSVDSGETLLRLEYYSPKNTWTIRSWTEIGALSIFNPDFK